MFRVGEGANPGPSPAGNETWCFGMFNPSGLTSKMDQVAHLPGQVWVATETHLTKLGVDKFKQGICSLGSPYRYIIPGSPCQTRSSADVGIFSGVLMMSQLPARPLAHDFPPNLFESSRIQVSGVCLGSIWVQIGMMYGVPGGSGHSQPLYQTECLLEALVDRIACEVVGPRIICGDMNFEPHELEQCQRLQSMGFREIQDVAAIKFGHCPVPTGKGSRRIDHMWLSPELQEALCSLTIDDSRWADHASVTALFSTMSPSYTFQHWSIPKPIPWPEKWVQGEVAYEAQADPSLAYATMWFQLESLASKTLGEQGIDITTRQHGRGQTLNTQTRRFCSSPCKLGREGDDHPRFTGLSLQHCRWFRQLRRLQALARNLRKQGISSSQFEQRCNLWCAIKNAKGFGGGFAQWWTAKQLQPVFADGFPFLIPSADTVQQLFESFRKCLRQFEDQLMQHRVRQVKARRKSNLQHVFRDCQKDRPTLVDALITFKQAVIAEIRPDDSSIVLEEPFAYQETLPLVSEGKVLEVIHADHDQIWLEQVEHLSVGSVVRQDKSIVTDTAILNEFEQVWAQRWQKIEHVSTTQWTQIVAFLHRVLAPVQWNFKPWSPCVVKKTIQTKKKRSAVGADGVSREDLLHLPIAGYQAISDMFQSIEANHRWPQQLTVGLVSSLDKGRGTDSVDGYRPITIYPLLYRAWSSRRAKEALGAIKTILPASIRGGVPSQQAKTVWFEVAQLVEQAHWASNSLQGVVLDIRRAFNALPRLPLWEMMVALGCPSDFIATWASFVASQTRRFKVRRSVGRPVSSCVGLPEGCGLSVFGMVLYDFAFDLWLQASCAIPKQLFVYVDDWQILFYYDPQHLDRLLASIKEFVQLLDLELDVNKSFTWSAHGADRSVLRSSELSVVLAARDLGAHQNYSKCQGNKVLTSRIKAMGPTWKQLTRSLAPYRAKLLALLQMAWTRCLYAISITPLGPLHFGDLRTQACRSLNVARVGSNPCLHLSTNGVVYDPECWAIIRTVREAREVGCHAQFRHMLECLASGESIPNNGPTIGLVRRLNKLGWVLDSQGFFTDDVCSFDPLTISWDEFMLRVRRAWPMTMATFVAHRKSFDGLAQADVGEVVRELKQHGEADQVYIRCSLDGTLFTDTTKTKEQRGKHSLCQHCGAVDGFAHQLWECPEFAAERQEFPWPDVVKHLPGCFANHGWVIQPPSWHVLLKEFHFIPPPLRLHWPQADHMECFDIFTDGTCLFPKEPKLRFAGWAVTWASAGTNSLDHVVLAAGHLRGVHESSFRAELVALIVALQVAADTCKPVRIWCDCQSVVNTFRFLQCGGVVQCNDAHNDLWDEVAAILAIIPEGNVSVGKVLSHGSQGAALTEFESWIFWHNQLVDVAAADYNVKRSNVFWVKWSQVVREVFQLRAVQHEIYKLIIKIGRKRSKGVTKPQQNRVSSSAVEEEHGGPDSGVRSCGQVPQQWQYTAALVRHCLRGNLDPILAWWTQVGIAGFNKFRVVWISGLQLYIDFCYAMNNSGPVMVRGKWLDPGIVGFRAHSLTMARRIKSFVTMWKALLKANQLRIPCKLMRPHSAGIAYWCQCYRVPWDPRRLKAIDDVILRVHGRQVAKPEHLGSASLFPIPEGNILICR